MESKVSLLALKNNPEQKKYERMWQFPQYRKYAPGEVLAPDFLKHTNVGPGDSVIDFGSGTGRGARRIAAAGCSVVMLDFAEGCLDELVAAAVARGELSFMQHDLLHPVPITADYGFCTDVMEHIQPECVDIVLKNILSAAKNVFFQISLQHDGCGVLINESLHLTVQPMKWWVKKFQELGAFIYYNEQRGEDAVFYVSGQRTSQEAQRVNGINVEFPYLIKNIKQNIARGLTQCKPHAKSDGELLLLGGGPSLNDYVDEIRSSKKPIICTNGTYNWCLENGITPSGLVIVDARPNNMKFVSKTIPGCKYLFASQCHPALFDVVPADQTWIWHSATTPEIEAEIEAAYGGETWYPVPGGRTVVLRAMMLLRMLGWKKQRVYGFDSCLRGDEHHAYDQPENEHDKVVTVEVGGEKFQCYMWMAGQAQDFQKMLRDLRGELDITVAGNGLCAKILRSSR